MRFFLIFLLGCPSSETDTNGDEGKTPSFQPAEGDWQGGEYTVQKDTCGIFDGSDSTDLDTYSIELKDSGDFRLTVAIDEGSVTWDCALDGKSFTCADQVILVQDFSSDGVDAILTMLGGITGDFESTEKAQIAIDVTATCDGPDCSLAEAATGYEFPCTATLTEPVSHVK